MEQITQIEFDKGYDTSKIDTFMDAENYMRYVVNLSKDTDYDVVFLFIDAWYYLSKYIGITTKYLKGLVEGKDKASKVTALLNKAECGKKGINRYYTEIVTKKSHIPLDYYKYFKDGVVYRTDTKIVTIGRTEWKHNCEHLSEVIGRAKRDEYKERMAELCKSFDKPKEVIIEPEPMTTPIQIGIRVNCLKCGREIGMPITPEENRHNELAHSIYTMFANDIMNGIRFCWRCESKNKVSDDGLWDTPKIVDLLGSIKAGTYLKATIKEFCEGYRKNSSLVSGGYVRNKVMALSPNKDIEVKVKEDCLLIGRV